MTLKAREVHIFGQMPSFDEREAQMESVLKNAVASSIYGETGLNSG